jgi:hypothetical protein
VFLSSIKLRRGLHSSKFKEKNAVGRTEESLVDLLSPISRLLVLGAIGIDEFIRAAKRAYLRAAIDVIVPAGRRLSASRLSVVTGMTRKEVSALLNYSKHEERHVIRRSGQQRALRVLGGWLADPRFQAQDGRPAELSLSGKKLTFRQLVKLYGGDVTPNAVLRELERMGVVELTSNGALRLIRRRNERNLRPDYQLSELGKFFGDYVLAVAPSSSESSFFGFKDAVVPSSGEAAAFISTFSRRATALLEGFEQWAAGHEEIKAFDRDSPSAKRVGIGFYLVNTDLRASTRSAAATNVRRRTRIEKRRK